MAMSTHVGRTFFYVLLLAVALPVKAVVLQNYTIALPVGSSDHGQPGLLCTPTKPIDLLTFFLLNYLAHAATVLTKPGERADDFFVSVVGSLLFPALGLYRGIEAILCGAVFVRGDDLRKAAKSSALCLVVRGADWRPRGGECVKDAILKRKINHPEPCIETTKSWEGEKVEGKEVAQSHLITHSPPYMFSKFGCPVFVYRRIIHGRHILPAGYRFAILPHDAEFENSSTSRGSQHLHVEISATYNMVKALIALAQSAYALTTLYRARGDQIEQFGYAAFGLTVAPYAVMSIMNLVGNLCRPEYPSLYLVESSTMDEARSRGGLFDGAVARVQEEANSRCTGDFRDGQDVDEVHFAAGPSDEVEAHFCTTSSTASRKLLTVLKPKIKRPVGRIDSISESATSSPASSSCRSTIHTHVILPLPTKLNYHRTDQDALLLIPCHAPIARKSTVATSSDVTSTPHQISAFKLRRTYPFFSHYTYFPSYKPSRHLTTALRWRILKYTLTTLISLLPLLITGLMSKFYIGTIPPRESSTWRGFVLQWLAFGSVTGLWWVLDQEGKDALSSERVQMGPWWRVVVYIVSSAPAVGGFVSVGQMVDRYGMCVWVGD
ncbi:hypothetical protein FB567DRAFT_182368 [Paraphoma chrysanthemicola]|uniref:Uncharacterized protein n=1 Tax=Paraphoma chrysanthemicola TaxID=798071 RepID=A0A8K0QW56_9PLEO|nr:hypothetical protein FB567DRAFT_182368 [Paraphoma chrysanthemicola]